MLKFDVLILILFPWETVIFFSLQVISEMIHMQGYEENFWIRFNI